MANRLYASDRAIGSSFDSVASTDSRWGTGTAADLELAAIPPRPVARDRSDSTSSLHGPAHHALADRALSRSHLDSAGAFSVASTDSDASSVASHLSYPPLIWNKQNHLEDLRSGERLFVLRPVGKKAWL